MNFKSALKQAADKSLADGAITTGEHATVDEIVAGPSVHRAGALEAAASHVLKGAAAGAFDWGNLITQLQTLLPFILQIIALFKKAPTA